MNTERTSAILAGAAILALGVLIAGRTSLTSRNEQSAGPQAARTMRPARVTFTSHSVKEESAPDRHRDATDIEKENREPGAQDTSRPASPDSATTLPLAPLNPPGTPAIQIELTTTTALPPPFGAMDATETYPFAAITSSTLEDAGTTSAPASTRAPRGGRKPLVLANLEGVVTSPEGARLRGATVYLCDRQAPFYFMNIYGSRYDDRKLKEYAQVTATDINGVFQFRTAAREFVIVARHASGIVMRTEQDFANHATIVVPPWGRLEGTVMEEKSVKAGAGVDIEFQSRPPSPGNEQNVIIHYYASTDEAGRFAIDKIQAGTPVSAGEYGLYRARYHSIRIQPGQTARVQFGGTGRPVTGRVAPKPGTDNNVSYQIKHISGHLSTTQFQRPFPIAPDGGFRVPDVPTGKFSILIHAYGKSHWTERTLGRMERSFMIPELPGGQSDEPLDLGSLELNLK